MSRSDEGLNQQLQVLDVHVVDVLAHLEALLRHSHSIQRSLLQLRSEAPPPRPAPRKEMADALTAHGRDMQRECDMLAEIISDLTAGLEGLSQPATSQNLAEGR